MTAIPIFGRAQARTMAHRDCPPGRSRRTPRSVVFAATLVLAAVTGLPVASVANLIPQADDPADPFLGL